MDLSSTQNRHFFHSFPRVKPGETRVARIAKGMQILRIIKDVGLVLAPEVVEWSIPQIDGTIKTLRYRQVRICFTELSEPELNSHAKIFGEFAVQFSLNALRRLGLLPVIYVPQTVESDKLFSSFGQVIVWMLENARYTMDQLHNLSIISNPVTALEVARKTNPEATHVDPNYVINLQNTNEAGEIDERFQVPASTVRGVLNYLGYKTAPFQLMRGALWAAESLFYPTDDFIHGEELAYYRQREWRMIPGLAADGREQMRLASSDEKSKLLDIDERFWLRELIDDRGKFLRIDEAQVLSEFQGGAISDLIERVIVPSEALEEAAELFGSKVHIMSSEAAA
jgi:hypothetical protein